MDIRTWRIVVEEHLGFPLRLTDDELLSIFEVKSNPLEAAWYIKLLILECLQQSSNLWKKM